MKIITDGQAVLRTVLLLASAIIISTIAGCTALDMDYAVPKTLIERATTTSQTLIVNGVDTGVKTADGIPINDATVAALNNDFVRIAEGAMGRYNNMSIWAALTQTTLAASITGGALGGMPIAAAGGIAASSLFLQHIFSIANTPAKANTYMQFLENLMQAENEFWSSLQTSCNGTGVTKISGTSLTNAGSIWLTRINFNVIGLVKGLQGLQPTLEQMTAATVPAGKLTNRLIKLADCGGSPTPGPVPTPVPTPPSNGGNNDEPPPLPTPPAFGKPIR